MEYWIIDSDMRTVEQYILDSDSYMLKQKSDTGILWSTAISGFEIPVEAIFEADANLVALQQILAPD